MCASAVIYTSQVCAEQLVGPTLLKIGSYCYVSELGQSLSLLSSVLTIILTCPNSDTLLCYSNNPFLVV